MADNEEFNEDDWEDADQNIREWSHDVQMPIDVGYRVPLALVLRPTTAATERIKLLELFFRTYDEYSLK